MERIPAWRICSGVTKSGSPTPNEMTSGIVLMMSKNLRIPEGFTDRTRSDSTSRLSVSMNNLLLLSGKGGSERTATSLLPVPHRLWHIVANKIHSKSIANADDCLYLPFNVAQKRTT